jgi:hypothetical protein
VKDAAERLSSAPWPIERPRDGTARFNRRFDASEEAVLRSIRRGRPFGSAWWPTGMVRREIEALLAGESRNVVMPSGPDAFASP